MKQVIFFDFDGTLVDTSERHYKVYRDILGFYGIPNTFTKEEFWRLKRDGKKTIDLLPNNVSKDTFQLEWIKRIENRDYLRFDEVFNGCFEVLTQLKELGHKIILVTLRQRKDNLFWELNRLGLNEYFDDIMVESPLYLKTKAILIQKCLKVLTPHNSIIVGDSEIDILTGKQLGMVTVASTYGIRSHKFLKKYNPKFYLDTLDELPKIISKIW